LACTPCPSRTRAGVGDAVVHRGTTLAWANRGDRPVRIVFLMIDGTITDRLERAAGPLESSTLERLPVPRGASTGAPRGGHSLAGALKRKPQTVDGSLCMATSFETPDVSTARVLVLNPAAPAHGNGSSTGVRPGKYVARRQDVDADRDGQQRFGDPREAV
jgi:hypothetical protein